MAVVELEADDMMISYEQGYNDRNVWHELCTGGGITANVDRGFAGWQGTNLRNVVIRMVRVRLRSLSVSLPVVVSMCGLLHSDDVAFNVLPCAANCTTVKVRCIVLYFCCLSM